MHQIFNNNKQSDNDQDNNRGTDSQGDGVLDIINSASIGYLLGGSDAAIGAGIGQMLGGADGAIFGGIIGNLFGDD